MTNPSIKRIRNILPDRIQDGDYAISTNIYSFSRNLMPEMFYRDLIWIVLFETLVPNTKYLNIDLQIPPQIKIEIDQFIIYNLTGIKEVIGNSYYPKLVSHIYKFICSFYDLNPKNEDEYYIYEIFKNITNVFIKYEREFLNLEEKYTG